MKKLTLTSLTLVSLILASGPAFSQTQAPSTPHSATHNATHHKAAASSEKHSDQTPPYTKEYEAANKKMHEAMMAQESRSNADYDFLSGMIAHHEGALEMAKIQLKYGTDPKVKKLAQSMIVTQSEEIKIMDKYMMEIEQNNGIIRPPGVRGK